MSKKLIFSLLIYLGVTLLFVGQIWYHSLFSSLEGVSLEQRERFNAFVGLGGVAISNVSFLRHPSLHTPFELYGVDGALRESTKETLLFTSHNEYP
jgi:hypothetical protein